MSQPDPWSAPTGLPTPAEHPTGEQQPNHSAPQYGQRQYGQPQYGQPQHSQPHSGWGQPGGYGPPPPRGTNTMAILSLVFAFIFAPAGIVMGVIAKRQIRERHEGGSGLATAGIVIGAVSVLLGVLLFVLVVVGTALSTGSTT